MIRCSLLGPYEVSVNGAAAPRELLWGKNLALLVYLACSPKRTRSRAHLLGLLWADKPEEKARGSLNQAIYTIRTVAGQDAIVTTVQQVKFADDTLTLDLDLFTGHTAAGRWEEASALVLGPFMEGFVVTEASEFEDWLTLERNAWTVRGVEALCRHAEALIAAGRLAEAIEVARRALRLDPLSAMAARLLMRALALAEDVSNALREFEEYAERLRSELGREPSPELRQLADLLRRETPSTSVSRPSRAEHESRRLPLVGRSAALHQLMDAWAECRNDGRATLGVITGVPGVGKSRLAEEVAARARLDGGVVATIRAVAADLGSPWSGVLGLARGGLLAAAGLAAAPPGALSYFATEVGEWAERFPGARGATPLRADRALIEVLRAATVDQPIMLLVDDAQWLDRDTVLGLEAAVRDLATTRLFVELILPPQPGPLVMDELRSRVGREIPGTVVHLEELGTADIRELARTLFPRFSDSQLERLARRIAHDSAGLPLLVVELLHAVALGLDIDKTKVAWPEEGRTLDETLPSQLPDAIIGAVRMGFHRLSADARLVLKATAALGDRVPVARLARAIGLPAERLAAALDELEWQRWLGAEPRGYSFVARIIREIVAEDLTTPGERQRFRDAAGP